MANSEICFMTATELAHKIQTRQLSALEVMEAHLAQIERINPKVNAIVTYLPERGIAGAKAADEALARGEIIGPLHGLPVAHKDLEMTKGIRTTYGSALFKDFVPDQNTLVVDRLQQAGAITIGKTNTPEFGAGSQTYNEVFGETLNPYDLTKTCGGSSGGAAVALACGMLPIADGSDMGGSLRNPASFCNVTGFRTAPGRVPSYPTTLGWFGLSVVGPMARTVQDIALLLSVMAGPDPRVPISITEASSKFQTSLERNFKGARVAWSPDFGGQVPVDSRVIKTIEAQRSIFEALGCVLEADQPDFAGANEAFLGWRFWNAHLKYQAFPEASRQQLKQTIQEEIAKGEKITGPELARLEVGRTQLYQRVYEFMQDYEFMIFPVSQVLPFEVNQRWVSQINGEKLELYTDWMKSCYFISATGLPAISVPCGFSPEGLPVGVQIVGRHQDELGVLQLAHAFEQATDFWKTRPPVCLND